MFIVRLIVVLALLATPLYAQSDLLKQLQHLFLLRGKR